jgi:YggT family protein
MCLMGASANVAVLADAITNVERFVYVFISVYGLLILAYIIMSWVRMPYSVWMSRIQGFLRDVCEPYLRLFRRILPPIGALDLSPMVGIFTLYLVGRLVVYVLDKFH